MSKGMKLKKVRRTHSIGFRISLLVTIAIMIFGMLCIYVILTRQERLYRNQVTQQWDALFDTLTPNLANLIASNDMANIESILDRIVSNRNDLSYLYLLDENQRVIYSIDVRKQGAVLPDRELKALAGAHPRKNADGEMIVPYKRVVKAGSSQLGSLYMGFIFRNSMEKEQLTKILTVEDAIQNATRNYLLTLDFYQVNFVTREMIGGIRDVAYFEVLRDNGTIVSSPEEKNILQQSGDKYDLWVLAQATTRKPVNTRRLKRGGKSILEVTKMIFDGDEALGFIQVGHDLSSLEAAIRRDKIILLLVTIATIILAVVVAITIANRISQPIVQLVGVAREIGAGNLNVKAEIRTGGDETRLLGDAFNEMVRGLRERDLVKDTFSRYVTKQVAEEILKDPGKIAPGGKKQEVTILFSDIRGFTAFSEGHDPEEVISHLNEYLSAMVDIIFKYEGTLDKFIGDAIMAVFGSPITHDDDPVRAVKTALEMQKRLDLLNEEWVKKGRTPLTIGIGINTGEVIVGNIGDIRRMEYTVIGDNVNLASRLEDLTKNYGSPIIISSSTYDKVKDIVEVKKLETVTVKGKAHAIEIYELLGLKS